MTWPYRKGDRDWPTYLHWWACGDELPDNTPDWLLDRWPNRLLNRLVCRIWGHVTEHDLVSYCIWCLRTVERARPPAFAFPLVDERAP